MGTLAERKVFFATYTPRQKMIEYFSLIIALLHFHHSKRLSELGAEAMLNLDEV